MFGFFETAPPPPSSPPDPSRLELAPSETQTFTLPDGRNLGFAAYGSTSTSDPVIFLFHGLPGSRVCGRSWNTICQEINVRLIAIDRPGNGLSTLANRALVDWPDDVIKLADHLRVERFSVLGASGGGPFALACARFIPQERLRSSTVVCGIGPMDAVFDTVPYLSWRLGGLVPWLVGLLARYVILPRIIAPYRTRDASRLKRVIEDQCTTPEEKALINSTDPDNNIDNAVVQFLEAFRNGIGGAMLDGRILTSGWGFDLGNIDSERVFLVHGDQDAVAPIAVARWMDERLGGGRLTVLEGKTHFTIWKDHSKEIFQRAVRD
ncbi:alpha/beta-hydrolase [Amniculicola lignicola CBS 123094]|uniref:Alpha/beta-hydrolase n=1 Tax=Amniculicola lignicola CBS 123094 TaxID=1392246 RepID=A0A6A5WZB8_9PLEO|nr:alpha/beta-hydrolase [Amniculicola lignicola CBS 123094]